MWSRIHLIPVLQAEEDRDLVRRHLADKAREKELLGAETKVYNNDRYASLDTTETTSAPLTCPVVSCDLHTRSHPDRPRSRWAAVFQRIQDMYIPRCSRRLSFKASETCTSAVILRLHVQCVSIEY